MKQIFWGFVVSDFVVSDFVSTLGSKKRPFFKNVVTRQKLIFFSGSISRSIYLTNMHLSTHFHDFSQKCTIFSHNRLTTWPGKSAQFKTTRVLYLDPLRPWQTRTHCCRQKCFPVCPRAQHLCPQQMFPSLRSPRNIMGNNVSATMCPRLPGPLGRFLSMPKPKSIFWSANMHILNLKMPCTFTLNLMGDHALSYLVVM